MRGVSEEVGCAPYLFCDGILKLTALLWIRACAAAALLSLAALSPAGAAERTPLVIMYPDMAPFIEAGDKPGEAKGELVDWLTRLAEKADIQLVWKGPIPRARIMVELEAGAEACHPNAKMTPERKGKFKFSLPVLPPPKWRVLVRNDSRVMRHSTVSGLLSDETLVMGFLLGSSFGPTIDAQIEKARSNVMYVRGSPSDLVMLLRARRIDYLMADITALEEISLETDDFHLLELPDLPEGEAGRVMCSLAVDDSIIDRLNAAIDRHTAGQPDE